MTAKAMLIAAIPASAGNEPPPGLPESRNVFWPQEADCLLIGWENFDLPPEALSLPRLMHERLPEIRREMRALVHSLGRLKVNGKEVQEHLKAGDSLSMWWCSTLYESHPKVLPPLYPLFKLRALEMLLEEKGIKTLVVVGGDDLLVNALRSFCLSAKLKFEFKPVAGPETAPRQNFIKRLYQRIPAPLRAVIRVKLWFLKHKFVFRRVKASRAQAGEVCIVTYFPNIDLNPAKEGRFRSRYWEKLHDLLAPAPGESPCASWLFIPFPSPQATLRQCGELRDAFMRKGGDGADMYFIDEFISWSDVYKAWFRYMRICLNSLKIEKEISRAARLPGSCLEIFPWLSWHYAESFRGWRCLERCLERIGLENYVRWAGKRKWFIFPMENCPWERMLTESAHRLGNGPSYGVQHSVIRPTDLRYFDDPRSFEEADCRVFQPDKIFCNGRGALEELLASGLKPERAGILEALRYMYLEAALSCQKDKTNNKAAPEYRRILVVTSFFADETENHLKMLAKAMPLLKRMEVTLKPHPYLPVDKWLAKLFTPEESPVLSNEPVSELLKQGCILWASNSTTVAMEAALLGLPVMIQGPAGDFDLSPAQGTPGTATIYSLADVKNFLARPEPARMQPDYFALDGNMPRWREFLGK